MSFNIPLKDVKDFPHGVSGRGGWYCRGCGDPINVGDNIFKPLQDWVCERCFTSGVHAATTRGRNRGQQQGFNNGRPGAPPPSGHAPPQASDIEMVDEDNWIEVIFDIIPQKHLKRVYASLAKTYHPDIGGSDEEMQRINDAYKSRQKENDG